MFPIQLPNVQNVSAGARASIHCPVGRTYNTIILQLGGTFTEAQITNIDVNINGKAVQHYDSGTELQLINDYYGRNDPSDDATQMLVLHFARPELNEVDRFTTAIGTLGNVQTFDIQLDIDAGAISPTLVAHAVLDVPRPLGLLTKIKRFPQTFGSAADQEIDGLPRGKHNIMAVHHFGAGGITVDDIEVEADGRKICDGAQAVIENIQKEWGRVPTSASHTSVDYCLAGRLSDALVTQNLQDYRHRLDLSAAGTVNTVIEVLDTFDGI